MEWIVIANRIAAHFYKYNSKGQFILIHTLANPIGRMSNKELTHDQPGLSRAKFIGSAPHSLGNEKDPHEDAADQFARKLSKKLINELNKNHKLTIKLSAEPKLLGKIKSYFKKDSHSKRIHWIAKDLEKVKVENWMSFLNLKKRKSEVELKNRFPI